MNEYRVIFDIINAPYRGWQASLVAFAFGVGAALIFLLNRGSPDVRADSVRRIQHYASAAAALLATFVAVAMLFTTYSDYRRLQRARRSGEGVVSEGVVADFVPDQPNGSSQESFRVGSRRFRYYSNDLTAAFHLTVGKGGPVREGMRVRILDYEGRILRIEELK